MDTPILDAKNQPMWIAATFVVALIALALSMASLYRVKAVAVITQAEVLTLNSKIAQKSAAPAATPAAPAAPAAPATK